jgi:hypothetical protein
MSVSDPGAKIEWGADSEPQKNERVPSSGHWSSEPLDPGPLALLTLEVSRCPCQRGEDVGVSGSVEA